MFNPKRTGYHGAHRRPGWGKTRPHYWPIAADQWGLNLKYPVFEESCVKDALPRYRGRRFRPDRCGAKVLRKSESNRPDCKPATPRTLRGPWPEIDWNVDWRRGGVGRVAPRPDFWQKIVKKSVKTSFFEVMSEVQKDSEYVFAGICIFLKIKLLNKFSCNLRSKSARSILTSPGPIRVKYDSWMRIRIPNPDLDPGNNWMRIRIRNPAKLYPSPTVWRKAYFPNLSAVHCCSSSFCLHGPVSRTHWYRP
jgi:hypothetical protein